MSVQVPTAIEIAGGVVGAMVLLALLRGRLGRTLLQGLKQLQEICMRLAQKGLHPERLLRIARARRTSSANASVTATHGTNGGHQLRLVPSEADQYWDAQPLETADAEVQQTPDEEAGSEVLMIVTRLLGLFFAVDVLLAVQVLDGLRTGLVIFEGDAGSGLIALPFSVPTIMGLLGWAMIVLMGAFLMEVVIHDWPAGLDFLPPRWRTWRASRILIRCLVAGGNVALFVYVVLLGMVAELQVYHIPWFAATVLVATLQNALANLAALFSIWIVVLGIGAAFALVCLVVWAVAGILRLFLQAWVAPEKPKPVLAIGGNGMGSGYPLPDGGQWKEPVHAASAGGRIDYHVGDYTVAPLQTTLLLAGDFGRRMLPDLAAVLPKVGGKKSIRVAGYVPTKRIPDQAQHRMITKDMDAEDVTISPKAHALIRNRPGYTVGKEVEAIIHNELLRIEQYTPKLTGRELILFSLDWEDVNSAGEPLRRLHGTLPRHVVVLVIELPARDINRPEIQAALEQATTLRDEGIVAATVLVNRQGPRVAKLDREKQGRFLARSLAGVITANRHYEENAAGAAVFEALGQDAPFMSLATGSVALSGGTQLSSLDPGRFVGGGRGRGDVEQVRVSLQMLGERVLTDATACLFPVTLDPERQPLYAEVFIPFDKKDHRFTEVCEGLEQWIAERVEGANVVFIAAAGEPDESVERQYFGQWTWFYGFTLDELTDLPMDIENKTDRTAEKTIGADKRTKSIGRRQESGDVSVTTTAKGKRGRRTPLRSSQSPV